MLMTKKTESGILAVIFVALMIFTAAVPAVNASAADEGSPLVTGGDYPVPQDSEDAAKIKELLSQVDLNEISEKLFADTPLWGFISEIDFNAALASIDLEGDSLEEIISNLDFKEILDTLLPEGLDGFKEEIYSLTVDEIYGKLGGHDALVRLFGEESAVVPVVEKVVDLFGDLTIGDFAKTPSFESIAGVIIPAIFELMSLPGTLTVVGETYTYTVEHFENDDVALDNLVLTLKSEEHGFIAELSIETIVLKPESATASDVHLECGIGDGGVGVVFDVAEILIDRGEYTISFPAIVIGVTTFPEGYAIEFAVVDEIEFTLLNNEMGVSAKLNASIPVPYIGTVTIQDLKISDKGVSATKVVVGEIDITPLFNGGSILDLDFSIPFEIIKGINGTISVKDRVFDLDISGSYTGTSVEITGLDLCVIYDGRFECMFGFDSIVVDRGEYTISLHDFEIDVAVGDGIYAVELIIGDDLDLAIRGNAEGVTVMLSADIPVPYIGPVVIKDLKISDKGVSAVKVVVGEIDITPLFNGGSILDLDFSIPFEIIKGINGTISVKDRVFDLDISGSYTGTSVEITGLDLCVIYNGKLVCTFNIDCIVFDKVFADTSVNVQFGNGEMHAVEIACGDNGNLAVAFGPVRSIVSTTNQNGSSTTTTVTPGIAYVNNADDRMQVLGIFFFDVDEFDTKVGTISLAKLERDDGTAYQFFILSGEDKVVEVSFFDAAPSYVCQVKLDFEAGKFTADDFTVAVVYNGKHDVNITGTVSYVDDGFGLSLTGAGKEVAISACDSRELPAGYSEASVTAIFSFDTMAYAVTSYSVFGAQDSDVYFSTHVSYDSTGAFDVEAELELNADDVTVENCTFEADETGAFEFVADYVRIIIGDEEAVSIVGFSADSEQMKTTTFVIYGVDFAPLVNGGTLADVEIELEYTIFGATVQFYAYQHVVDLLVYGTIPATETTPAIEYEVHFAYCGAYYFEVVVSEINGDDVTSRNTLSIEVIPEDHVGIKLSFVDDVETRSEVTIDTIINAEGTTVTASVAIGGGEDPVQLGTEIELVFSDNVFVGAVIDANAKVAVGDLDTSVSIAAGYNDSGFDISSFNAAVYDLSVGYCTVDTASISFAFVDGAPVIGAAVDNIYNSEGECIGSNIGAVVTISNGIGFVVTVESFAIEDFVSIHDYSIIASSQGILVDGFFRIQIDEPFEIAPGLTVVGTAYGGVANLAIAYKDVGNATVTADLEQRDILINAAGNFEFGDVSITGIDLHAHMNQSGAYGYVKVGTIAVGDITVSNVIFENKELIFHNLEIGGYVSVPFFKLNTKNGVDVTINGLCVKIETESIEYAVLINNLSLDTFDSQIQAGYVLIKIGNFALGFSGFAANYDGNLSVDVDNINVDDTLLYMEDVHIEVAPDYHYVSADTVGSTTPAFQCVMKDVIVDFLGDVADISVDSISVCDAASEPMVTVDGVFFKENAEGISYGFGQVLTSNAKIDDFSASKDAEGNIEIVYAEIDYADESVAVEITSVRYISGAAIDASVKTISVKNGDLVLSEVSDISLSEENLDVEFAIGNLVIGGFEMSDYSFVSGKGVVELSIASIDSEFVNVRNLSVTAGSESFLVTGFVKVKLNDDLTLIYQAEEPDCSDAVLSLIFRTAISVDYFAANVDAVVSVSTKQCMIAGSLTDVVYRMTPVIDEIGLGVRYIYSENVVDVAFDLDGKYSDDHVAFEADQFFVDIHGGEVIYDGSISLKITDLEIGNGAILNADILNAVGSVEISATDMFLFEAEYDLEAGTFTISLDGAVVTIDSFTLSVENLVIVGEDGKVTYSIDAICMLIETEDVTIDLDLEFEDAAVNSVTFTVDSKYGSISYGADATGAILTADIDAPYVEIDGFLMTIDPRGVVNASLELLQVTAGDVVVSVTEFSVVDGALVDLKATASYEDAQIAEVIVAQKDGLYNAIAAITVGDYSCNLTIVDADASGVAMVVAGVRVGDIQVTLAAEDVQIVHSEGSCSVTVKCVKLEILANDVAIVLDVDSEDGAVSSVTFTVDSKYGSISYGADATGAVLTADIDAPYVKIDGFLMTIDPKGVVNASLELLQVTAGDVAATVTGFSVVDGVLVDLKAVASYNKVKFAEVSVTQKDGLYTAIADIAVGLNYSCNLKIVDADATGASMIFVEVRANDIHVALTVEDVQIAAAEGSCDVAIKCVQLKMAHADNVIVIDVSDILVTYDARCFSVEFDAGCEALIAGNSVNLSIGLGIEAGSEGVSVTVESAELKVLTQDTEIISVAYSGKDSVLTVDVMAKDVIIDGLVITFADNFSIVVEEVSVGDNVSINDLEISDARFHAGFVKIYDYVVIKDATITSGDNVSVDIDTFSVDTTYFLLDASGIVIKSGASPVIDRFAVFIGSEDGSHMMLDITGFSLATESTSVTVKLDTFAFDINVMGAALLAEIKDLVAKAAFDFGHGKFDISMTQKTMALVATYDDYAVTVDSSESSLTGGFDSSTGVTGIKIVVTTVAKISVTQGNESLGNADLVSTVDIFVDISKITSGSLDGAFIVTYSLDRADINVKGIDAEVGKLTATLVPTENGIVITANGDLLSIAIPGYTIAYADAEVLVSVDLDAQKVDAYDASFGIIRVAYGNLDVVADNVKADSVTEIITAEDLSVISGKDAILYEDVAVSNLDSGIALVANSYSGHVGGKAINEVTYNGELVYYLPTASFDSDGFHLRTNADVDGAAVGKFTVTVLSHSVEFVGDKVYTGVPNGTVITVATPYYLDVVIAGETIRAELPVSKVAVAGYNLILTKVESIIDVIDPETGEVKPTEGNTVVVTPEDVTIIEESGLSNITIVVPKADDPTKEAAVELPAESFEKLIGDYDNITLSVDFGAPEEKPIFDRIIEKLTPQNAEKVRNGTFVEVTVLSNGVPVDPENVTDLGTVTVSVDFDLNGRNPDKLFACYIDESDPTNLNDTYACHYEDGKVYITTTHFSFYLITEVLSGEFGMVFLAIGIGLAVLVAAVAFLCINTRRNYLAGLNA